MGWAGRQGSGLFVVLHWPHACSGRPLSGGVGRPRPAFAAPHFPTRRPRTRAGCRSMRARRGRRCPLTSCCCSTTSTDRRRARAPPLPPRLDASCMRQRAGQQECHRHYHCSQAFINALPPPRALPPWPPSQDLQDPTAPLRIHMGHLPSFPPGPPGPRGARGRRRPSGGRGGGGGDCGRAVPRVLQRRDARRRCARRAAPRRAQGLRCPMRARALTGSCRGRAPLPPPLTLCLTPRPARVRQAAPTCVGT